MTQIPASYRPQPDQLHCHAEDHDGRCNETCEAPDCPGEMNNMDAGGVPYRRDKPPLGIKPRWVLDKEREKEIMEAIGRYVKAGVQVPKEWVKELADLMSNGGEK